jgi:hypothetical protein
MQEKQNFLKIQSPENRGSLFVKACGVYRLRIVEKLFFKKRAAVHYGRPSLIVMAPRG